jgi:hypothetical protein
MSVITKIQKTKIVDRDYLIKALEDLGYAWEEVGGVRLLGPQMDIKLKGRSAGFKKTGDHYSFVSRGTRRRVRQDIESDLKRITQRYIYHIARDKLEAQGFTLAQEEVQDGVRIHMVLRRMA